MGMLYEYDDEDEPRGLGGAHPPLEPVGKHHVVCPECGDAIRECTCGLSLTDHADEFLCDDCVFEKTERHLP